ncbi:PilZ domain-containing protein [Desulfovulcanus sp.]
MTKQKRTYSRISTRLKAYIRKLPSPDSRPLFSGCLACNAEPSITKNLQGPHIPRELVTFLQNMDAKLDMILSLLSQDSIQEDFPIRGEVVEISGAGLKFVSKTEFKEKEALELAIVLSQLPLRVVSVVGLILRLENVQNLAEAPVYVVKFTNIRDIDRENIVQFVFQEQREQIRERKNEF